MQIQPGLTYLTRVKWVADTSIPRLGVTVARSNRTEAILHHTVIIDSDATKNLWTNRAEVKAKMRQLQVIRPDLGKDVPYNFVMFLMEDGTIIVCEGRGLDRSGAHTKGHNYYGMATALQGNFMLAVNLRPYITGMSRWWGWLKYDKGMNNLGSWHPQRSLVFGHRDFRDPNDTSTWTACPGDRLYTVIPQLEFKEKEDDMAKLIKKTGSGTVYVTDGVWKWGVPSSTVLKELQTAGLVSGSIATISATLFGRIKMTHDPVAVSSGLSAAQAKDLTEIRNSLRGGDLPGIWVKAKGSGTIYYAEYKGGVLVRHHARNPQSYMGVGGNWKVIEVTPEQLELMPRGPGLPDLRIV